MTETDPDGESLPLDTSVGEAGPHAPDAFALLGNETRLAILLALWNEYDPHAAENTVSFSRIFDQVAYEDPGSFSYHLQKLTGQFIRQHDDGYELTTAGHRFIQSVIAGAGVTDTDHEPTSIDQPCPFCDAPTAISYHDGLVVQRCTECEGTTTESSIEGYLSAVPFDPTGLADRTGPEIRAASRVAAWRQTQIMFDGLCPACSGPVESWLECCPDHDPTGVCDRCGSKFPVLARFECRICKNHNVSSPKALALFHPAVVGFYDRMGVSTRIHADDVESVRRVFELLDRHEIEIRSHDPPSALVTVTYGDDKIRLIFDETARVIDVLR